MQRARIVYNPAARNAPPRERLIAATRAAAPEWEIDIAVSEAAGHGSVLAREAAHAGATLVIACGGDGTINEVVNGLAGCQTALGVLRGGMGDVFAKEAGIPKAPERALPLLLSGRRRRFDLGTANGRYFLLMAGVGFDAEVVRSVPEGQKQKLGSTSYALWALRRLPSYRSRRVTLAIEGVSFEQDLYWLLASNTRSYGGVLDIAHEARVDDGMLDTYAFSGGGALWLVGTALRLLSRRLAGAPGVAFRRLSQLEVKTPGLPVQVDGEYAGETPVILGVAPAALDVVLPVGRGERLFGAA